MEGHNARSLLSALLPHVVARDTAAAVSRQAARSRHAPYDLPTGEQASSRSRAVLGEFGTERRCRHTYAFSGRQRPPCGGAPFLRFGFQWALSRPARSARIAGGVRSRRRILVRASRTSPRAGPRPAPLLRVRDAVFRAWHACSAVGSARGPAIQTSTL